MDEQAQPQPPAPPDPPAEPAPPDPGPEPADGRDGGRPVTDVRVVLPQAEQRPVDPTRFAG